MTPLPAHSSWSGRLQNIIFKFENNINVLILKNEMEIPLVFYFNSDPPVRL
jgi:hypothetical protein